LAIQVANDGIITLIPLCIDLDKLARELIKEGLEILDVKEMPCG
jgi:hypothetical protein